MGAGQVAGRVRRYLAPAMVLGGRPVGSTAQHLINETAERPEPGLRAVVLRRRGLARIWRREGQFAPRFNERISSDFAEDVA